MNHSTRNAKISLATAIVILILMVTIRIVLSPDSGDSGEIVTDSGGASTRSGVTSVSPDSPLATMPEGMPETGNISGWSRVPTGSGTRYRLRWSGDARSAAAIIGALVRRDDLYQYTLVPGEGQEWTVEATIDYHGDSAPVPAADPSEADALSGMLRRPSAGHGDEGAQDSSGTAGATGAPASAGAPAPPEPLNRGAAIADGGNGTVILREGTTYHWSHRDDVLMLEPER